MTMMIVINRLVSGNLEVQVLNSASYRCNNKTDPVKDQGENPIISAQEDDFAASMYSGDDSHELVVVI